MKKVSRKTFVSLSLVLCCCVCYTFCAKAPKQQQRRRQEQTYPNSSPVIGVLSQPWTNPETNTTEFIIAASYVKWLEAAGARSIPIPYDAPDSLVDDILYEVNGVLFPGGSSPLPESAWRIWDMVLAINNQAGSYFPLWGTCLGFEYLVQMASGYGAVVLQNDYDAENISMPLYMTTHDAATTTTTIPCRLYADPTIQKIATTEAVAMNNHIRGLLPFTFHNSPDLSTMFQITSTNVDRQGKPFVSSIESSRYPIYGVQYHPEKNPFEYGTFPNTNVPYEHINHSPDAIYFSLHLANFLVNLTRRNEHTYTKVDEYPLVHMYEMKRAVAFQQYYVIPALASASSRAVKEDMMEAATIQ